VTHDLSIEDVQIILQQLELWTRPRTFRVASTESDWRFTIISDASSSYGMGFAVFDHRRHLIAPPVSKQWDARHAFTHEDIFWLELLAATAAIITLKKQRPGYTSNVLLVLDNLGATFVINQGSASPSVATRTMLDIISQSGFVCRAMHIPTELNPTDHLTRPDKGLQLGDVAPAWEWIDARRHLVEFTKFEEC
jgi:hypothetical protein